jgi:hypothetical protein
MGAALLKRPCFSGFAGKTRRAKVSRCLIQEWFSKPARVRITERVY